MNQPMMKSEWICRNGDLSTRVQCLGPGLIRVTRTRRPDFLTRPSPVTCPQTPRAVPVVVTDGFARLQTDWMEVRICAASGAVSFFDRTGRPLLREPDSHPAQLVEKPVILNRFPKGTEIVASGGADGIRAAAVSAEPYRDRDGYECRQHFVFDGEEGLYGLGSHEEGIGNLRGKNRLLYQHNLKAVVPVLVSTRGWGILFDMGCMMTFHDDEEGSYLWAECADELDWYFFYGDGSYRSCMSQYRTLTGEAPMLPLYALGYIQSKERYQNAQELLEIAAEYRRREVPLDMVVLDWQSWPEGQWGWKHFDPERFPDPAGMIRALHEKHVRLMISIWPSMQGEANEDRKEMLAREGMLGNQTIYNAFDPAARRLYWEQAERELFSSGVDAWWCDCSEPFESDWRGSMKPEPFIRARINTDEAKRYLDPTQISLYSLYHSRGIYEGQRAATSDRRVCNLTRSSWAGQHRYATVTWSGDVSATWETLRRQIPEGLNFCAAGEPYWSTDIGAFFVKSADWGWFVRGDYDRGVEDPDYRELFTRWAQFAVFLPMMRAHGTDTPREIWRFGNPGDPWYDAIEQAIHLRYHLIPYLYSLMWETRNSGIPMLRVPALVFPEDPVLRSLDDEMMVGDAVLVKPVTHPVSALPAEERTESVYLPAGHRWTCLRTGEVYDGGQRIRTAADLDQIPVFIRSGAILPWGQIAPSTAEQRLLPPEIAVYPGEDGAFEMYQDAGEGYGYERGEYAVIPFEWKDAERMLQIGPRRGEWTGMPAEMRLRISLAGNGRQEIVWRGNREEIRF